MLLRDTLVKAHPTFAWLRWTWLLDILLIALMLAICVGFMAFLEGRPASLYLLVIIISGPEAIHGLFAALSGVYVLDYRFRGYLYVYEGGARSAGRLQFCLAIILTGMAFLLAIATPGE